MPEWEFLGAGMFNNAYRSSDGKSVLKIAKQAQNETDTPQRSVRLWNQINSHLPPPASFANDEKLGAGWVCPFVEGEQADDAEISGALLDIFNRSGRIIVDAPVAGNFRKTAPPNSQIVCVDIGMALQMDQREQNVFGEANQDYSIVSQATWKELNSGYELSFIVHELNSPQTVNTLKALLFIKNNRPDLYDVNFLKKHPPFITSLAQAYDAQKRYDLQRLPESKMPQSLQDGLELLKQQRPINVDNIKKSCINELKKYIESRGSINMKGEFEPSLLTRIFRDTQLTSRKVAAAKNLIEDMRGMSELREIESAVKGHLQTPDLTKARFASGLGTSLGKCMLIMDTAKRDAGLDLGQDSSVKPT